MPSTRTFPSLRPDPGALVALVITALLLTAADPRAADAQQPRDEPQGTREDLFTHSAPFRIQIEIGEKEMEILRDYHWRGWGGASSSERPSVKATVKEGGRIYKDVSIHMKGAAGSFRPIDDNPALTLHFDKHVKGQTFHGLKRFSLNNSVQDRSLLSEQISREMFAQAGVPVPRATSAQVTLNGRVLGVYVLVEAFNKQFLARHFKNPNGNLYDGGFVKDITHDLEKSSGKNPEDRADLRALVEAAAEPDLTQRLARLEKLLDLDRFITFMALDVMTCNWDGYSMNRNNYRLYHDPDSDKIVFMPHGLDQMFGVARASPNMPLFPRMSGLVANAAMQIPEVRKRYRERVSQLMTRVYQVQSLTNRVWQLQARLQPLLSEGNSSPDGGASNRRAVALLCQRISRRAESINDQLLAPSRVLKFDAGGVARFTNWNSRAEFGKPTLDRITEPGGKTLLHISAPAGSCVGSWFTKVQLEPGRYRFEARVRTRGVTADPGDRKGGAGLRVTDRRSLDKLLNDNAWRDIAFEFETLGAQADFGFMAPIQDADPTIELICELRAAKGEAWFDPDSLRLIKK